MLKPQDLHQFICKEWQEKALPSLMDYIRIPNKSPHFDLNWQEHGFMDKAVSHVVAWCKEHAPAGLFLEELRLANRTPLILMDIPGELEGCVILYGHLDKQPEMTGWRQGLGPWTPVLDDNRLYGRGSGDDGYAVYSAIIAIRALQAQGLPHPRCIILIECCEESGSLDLPFYLDLIKEKIGEPNLVFGLDSGAGNYDQLWMTTSLRGLVSALFSVELLTEGVHSGSASGLVADSFRVARALLSRLEDEKTGQIGDPGFYCDIPEERLLQAKLCDAILKESIYKELPLVRDGQPCSYDLTELILNRTWRPALTVIGAEGLPSVEDAGNVMRPRTSFKLSIRLPPLVDPEKASAALLQCISLAPPYQAKVNCTILDKAKGWHAPPLVEWLDKAVTEASLAFYQNKPAYMGEGGTIPFMGILGEKFPKAQFVITGVLGPKSNAHGPNEFLDLDMVKKLTSCIAYILSKVEKQ